MVKGVDGSKSASPAPQPESGGEKDTVRDGEKLSDVAQRHGVSEEDIKKANPGIDPGKIGPGVELVIPPKAEKKEAPGSAEEPGLLDAGVKFLESSFSSLAAAAQVKSQIPSAAPKIAPSSSGPVVVGERVLIRSTLMEAATKELKPDDKGPDVKKLQHQLNEWRKGNGKAEFKETGVFDNNTAWAVIEFKKAHKLEDNNIAGPDVTGMLDMETNPNFKKLSKETQGDLLDGMEYFGSEPIVRGALMKLAADPDFGKLSQAHQTQVIVTYGSNIHDGEYLKNVHSLAINPEFIKLDDGVQTRILDNVANIPAPRYAGDMEKLIKDKSFQSMSSSDQLKTLNVFDNTTPDGRKALMKTLHRTVDGTPALLTRGIGTNDTLLDQLDRLATTDLDAKLVNRSGNPADKYKVTEQLLQEVGDPDYCIDQDNRGTCTVTSISHALASKNPAEYARLVTDLATTGSAKLKNGDTITVPGGDAWAQDNSTRSHGERLLQSALMAYGNPSQTYQNWNPGSDGIRGTSDDGFADPTNPTLRSLDGFTGRSKSGLFDDETAKVLSGLYGKKYEAYSGSWNLTGDSKDMAEKASEQLLKGNRPVWVGVKWNGSGHELEVLEITKDKVIFRNPWGGGNIGATGTTNGTKNNSSGAGPLRQVEDGNKAIESMTLEDFQAAVTGIIVPK